MPAEGPRPQRVDSIVTSRVRSLSMPVEESAMGREGRNGAV